MITKSITKLLVYMFLPMGRLEGVQYLTSELRLNDAHVAGLIDCNKEQTPYGAWYTFFTKSGVQIAKFYKDSTFGFGTQALGVELNRECISDPAMNIRRF